VPKNNSTSKGHSAKARAGPTDQSLEQAISLAKFPEENPLPVFRAELSGRVIYANLAAQGLLDLKPAPKFGRLSGELAKVLRARKQGKRLPKEVDVNFGDRMYAFAVAYVSKESYVNFYGRDITEGKRAEAELLAAKEAAARTEALLKDAIENLSEAFVIYDPDGRLVTCNQEYRRTYGYSEEEAKPGVHYSELDALDIRRGNIVIGDEFSGSEEYLRHKAKYRKKPKGTFDILLKDGRWLHATDHRTSNGGIVSIQRDITERRRTEDDLVAAKEAAARSEALFKDAIEHLSEAFVIYETDGRLVTCNKEFRSIYGYSEDQAKTGVHFKELGKLDIKLGNVVVGDEYGGGAAYLKRKAEYRKNLTGSFTVHLKDGRWLHTTDRRTSSGGIVSIQRDITEAMRTSEALRAAKEEAEDANKVIELRQRIATAANEATVVEDAVQVCLDEVCAYTGWPVGHAFAVTPEGGLKSMKVWHLDQPKRYKKFREITESRIYPKAKGISSRVLATGKPVWNNDVSRDKDFKRAVLAKGIEVKAGFAFPVLVGKDVVAIIEFFSRDTMDPNDALLDMTAHVGTLLGRVIERKRAETELAEKETLLSTSLTNMSDGIFVLDAEQRIVMYNERYVELVEVPTDQIEFGIPVRDWIRQLAESGFYGPGDPRKLTRDRMAVLTDNDRVETEMVTRSGRHIHVRKSPLKDGGAVVTVSDITSHKTAEQALRNSEELLRIALGNMSGGIFMIDKDFKLQVMSPSFLELYGYPPELVRDGAPLEDIVRFRAERGDYGPGDPNKLTKDRLKGYLDRTIQRSETTLPGGRVVELFRTPTKDGGTVAVFNEITERKRVEENLARTLNELSAVMESIDYGIVFMDSDLRARFINRAFQDMWDLPDEFVAQEPTMTELMSYNRHNEVYPVSDEKFDGYVERRVARVREGSIPPTELKRRDGRTYRYQCIALPDGGRMLTYFDLTEFKRAEVALRESEQRYETITTNVPGVVYQRVMHPDGSIAYPYVSPGVQELYGLEPDAVMADSSVMLAVLHPDERERFFESLKESAERLETWNLDFRVITADGDHKWIGGSSRVYQSDDGDIFWDGFLLDITEQVRAQEAVQSSEFQLKSILGASPVGVMISAKKGGILFTNSRWLEMAGAEDIDTESIDIRDFYMSAADRERVSKMMREDKLVLDEEMEFKRIGGGTIWLAVSMTPMTFADQPAIISWFYDLTERRKGESALREMLEAIPMPMVLSSAETDKLLFVNEPANKAFGVNVGEARGSTVTDVYDDPKDRIELIRRLRKDGKVDEFEARINSVDGRKEWVLMSARLLDYQGQKAVLVASNIITERKRLEEEVARKSTILEATLENMNQGIYMLDADLRVVAYNRNAADHLTVPESLMESGAGLEEIVRHQASRGGYPHLDGDTETQVQYWLDQLTESSEQFTYQRQRPDGVWLEITSVPLPGGSWVRTISDITERKLAEEDLRVAKEAAEDGSRSKSDFLANMSHELRTPLNAIIGYGEILLDEADDMGHSHLTPDLERIRTAGRHLLDLINDILDLSKIEAGKMNVFHEKFDISQLIAEVTDTTKSLAEVKGNSLFINCGDDIGGMYSDMTKIRQALLNLLSNAAKFTEKGTITLNVSRRLFGADDWIEFEVSDTGIGMSPEQINAVFDAFMQADTSTTREFGGTGLGLAITRRFCTMLGGDIKVSSERDKGSSFVISLPADAPAHGLGADEAEYRATSAGIDLPEDAPTILVVDDDPAVRDLLTRHLERGGYRAITASTGDEALRMAQEFIPDAITLDVVMPSTDGWSVLSALKKNPRLADIPVIMITIVDDRGMGFSLGAADYLTKPFDRDELLAALEKHRSAKSRCRVLVVDDDPDVREVMAVTLGASDCSVITAENGVAGLESLDKEIPDVILLDLIMPKMDGFEFMARLQEKDAWREIPVVVVTAKTMTRKDTDRLEGRIEKFIQKGDHLEALVDTLDGMFPRQTKVATRD